ncbi:hypothetical protein VKT23_006339 [Stygiomarasmius scandens]|uniref:Uncharacterized protein n=1 Tax=Marasmiellus scandens TaxID=2682957 RepID=A0ABR1JT62_9AGAR
MIRNIPLTWNNPPLSQRATPFDGPGAVSLPSELIYYLTPSWLAATNQQDGDEFFQMATSEWLNRFPTDALTGTPSYIIFNHAGDLEAVEKSIEKEFQYSDEQMLKRQSRHLLDIFQVNTLYGTVKPIKRDWHDELCYVLARFDEKYPVVGLSYPEFPSTYNRHYALYHYIHSEPRYQCFSHRTKEQIDGGVLLWSWFHEDYDSD